MYRVIQDLTRDELDELKLSYLMVLENDTEYPVLLPDPDDIPDEALFEYYDGMMFSEDDSFVTLRRRKRNDTVRYPQGSGRSLSRR